MTNDDKRDSDAMSAEKDTQNETNKHDQGQSKSDNAGNFANDREKASEAGKKGGQS